MNRLAKLELKIDNPGKYGAPSDNDLKYMVEKYTEMSEYFKSIGDKVVTQFLIYKYIDISNIIEARKN